MLVHPNALGIATGEQRRSGRRANRRRYHEARKLPAFLGNAVDIRRANSFGTKTAQVAVALVIGKDDDEVGLSSGRGFNGEKETGQKTGQDGICLFHVMGVWVVM